MQYIYSKIAFVFLNAPITVYAHLARLVVGGDFEGGLTPAACPLGEAHLPYMWGIYCTCAHMCSTDLTKETAPVEGT